MKNIYTCLRGKLSFYPKSMVLLAGIFSLAIQSFAQTTTRFNDGYLTVFKVTSGAVLNNTGTAIITEEYLPTTATQTSPNYSVSLPTGAAGIVISGTATSSGEMTRSESGRYLILPGYAGNIGDANSTFISNGTARTLNASGTFGLGVVGTIYSTANDLRGASSDDGTNYWFSGGSIGIRYTNNGTTVATISTTSTNTRVVNIFNGQLFYSTGSGTNGIYKVGNGKPTTTGQTSTLQAASTAPYSFSVSPDGLTIYAFGSSTTIVRFTYSGTYNPATFTYSGGTWSAASTGFTLSAATGVAVDWTGYTFSTGLNGARIYACNPTNLVAGNDNGTGAITTTILRTISGNNAFRGLAFSPIKQTVSLGVNSPATGNLTPGAADAVLFQFNLSADEGNSTIKKLILSQGGTATIGVGNSVDNFRLIYDANSDGAASAAEISASLATGTISGSNITFSNITQTPYITQGGSNNYLVIADISAAGSGTVAPSIVSNYAINSVNYTTNVFNAGGSPVNIGTAAPTGNTLSIGGGTPPPVINSPATATSAYGASATYTITATNSPTSFNATSLPAGMTFTGNQITVSPLTAVGVYTISISASNAGGTGSATLTYTVTEGVVTQANFTGVIVPQFMSGDALSRLPVMFRATVSGLLPSTTYRYITQAVLSTDFGSPANSGVGNPVLINSSGTVYTYTTSPDVTVAGNYETFTTNASGTYTGWFGLVNSNNARFTTAGNTVYPILRVAENSAGVTQIAYALDLGIRVLNFSPSAGANNGSFLRSTSGATAKNLVAIYDNIAGTGRPLYAAPVENTGVTIASVISGYLTTNGSWNAVIPNNNAIGVRRIEQLSVTTGNLVGCAATDADGVWPTGSVNTVNPTNGTTPITIATADAPLNTCVNATTSTVTAQSSAIYSYTSNIGYINYQSASGLTASNSVGVGGFTINDLAPNDGLSTTLTNITFTIPAATGATIRTAALFDGSTNVKEVTGVSGTSISFSGLSLTAPSNSTKNFELRVTFKNTVTDKYQMSFTVSSVTAAAGGSSFAAADGGGAATSTAGDFNRIDVVATRLVFVQGPTNTPVLSNMTPAVTVAANDAAGFNNTDVDYVTTVTLSLTTTTCSSLTGNSATPVNGIATFSALQGTVVETGLTLTASSGAFTAVVSGNFDFTGAVAVSANLITWNFADQNTTADGGIPVNSSNIISVVGGVGTITYPSGAAGAGDYSISGTSSWASGSGTKYWLINLSTAGYQSLTLSSKQQSSNTGPKDFKIQYSIGSSGIWTDVPGGAVTVANDFVSGVVTNLSLPAACENQSLVYLRWIMTSNIAVTGGAVASGGTSRIDEITVNGVTGSPATGLYYQTKATGNFESACIWETSSSATGPWSQAPAPPDFSAKAIKILNTYTVTITANETLDELTVNNGGTLILGDKNLILNNGTGTDITVNGTFIDNASSANGTSFNTGATWSLGSGATFIKTRNSSASVYRDNYEGGMSTIPSDANWIIRYTGASDVSFTTIGTTYPNLGFENASATPSYTFITKFTGTGSTATIKGNLDIGGVAYTNTVAVINENSFSSPLLINGNLTIRTGSTLTNLGTPSGTGFEVKGNLVANGTLTVNNANSGLLKFSGTSPQNISGAGIITLQDMTVANSGTTLSVNRDLDIAGTLNFTSGSATDLASGIVSIKSSAATTSNIANTTGAAITYGAGRFRIERYVGYNRKWQLLAVPVTEDALSPTFRSAWMESGAANSNPAPGFGMQITDPLGTLAGFDASSLSASVKTYLPLTDTYLGILTPDAPIATPAGYMTFVRGDRLSLGTPATTTNPTRLRTTGKIKTGDISVSDITAIDGKFQVIGNPYASATDLRAINFSNVSGAGGRDVYVWDPTIYGNNGFGKFVTLSKAGTDYIANSTPIGLYSSAAVTNFIQSGQAFMVKSSGGTGAVTFHEAAKNTASQTVSFIGSAPQMLRVGMYSLVNGTNATGADGAVVLFGDDFSNSADNNDAEKMAGGSENLSFKTGNKLIAIERRHTIETDDTLHLNISAMQLLNYRFVISAENLDANGRAGFFIDRYTNAVTPLNLAGSTTINFNIANIAGSYAADRFIIVFHQLLAAPLPVNFTGISALRNEDKTVSVKWNADNEINIANYKIEYSSDGNSFAPVGTQSPSNNNGGAASYTYVDGHATAGYNYYRIRGNSLNGQFQYSAIAKVGPIGTASEISVYPNPAEGKRVNIYFQNKPAGNYVVSIINGTGQVIKTETVTVQNNNTIRTIQLGENIPAGIYNLSVKEQGAKPTSIVLMMK